MRKVFTSMQKTLLTDRLAVAFTLLQLITAHAAVGPTFSTGLLMFTNALVPGTNNFWRVRSVP
jgi:hypothetical protein